MPSEIQALTGITHEMLAGAPRFAELADELHERLAGRVFIAHNARFDYGFLRREFDRAGIKFHAAARCAPCGCRGASIRASAATTSTA